MDNYGYAIFFGIYILVWILLARRVSMEIYMMAKEKVIVFKFTKAQRARLKRRRDGGDAEGFHKLLRYYRNLNSDPTMGKVLDFKTGKVLDKGKIG